MSIRELETCAEIADSTARELEIDRRLLEARSILKQDRKDVRVQRAQVELALNDPALAQRMGDEVTHILNDWDRAVLGWRRLLDSGVSGDAVLPPLREIREDLEGVQRRAAFLTVPKRVNEHLAHLRIGQALDFEATFLDELPSEDERLALLRYLQAHPAAIDGVVDVGLGRVTRASSRVWRRLMSLLLLVLSVVSSFGVVWVVAYEVPQMSIPGATTDVARWEILAKAMIAIFAGALVHLLVSAVKQSRQRKSSEGFLALDDLLVWAHVREVQLVLTVASLVILMIGTILITDRVDVTTMFFAGYAYDSLIDVVLERFDKLATSQVASLGITENSEAGN